MVYFNIKFWPLHFSGLVGGLENCCKIASNILRYNLAFQQSDKTKFLKIRSLVMGIKAIKQDHIILEHLVQTMRKCLFIYQNYFNIFSYKFMLFNPTIQVYFTTLPFNSYQLWKCCIIYERAVLENREICIKWFTIQTKTTFTQCWHILKW